MEEGWRLQDEMGGLRCGGKEGPIGELRLGTCRAKNAAQPGQMSAILVQNHNTTSTGVYM
jgi:hypothetical protein